MSDHLHPTYVPGCYRCDLSRAETRLARAVAARDRIIPPDPGDPAVARLSGRAHPHGGR